MKEKDPLSAMMRYCAEAEHCEKDVRLKLFKWQLPQEEVDDIMEKLRRDNYLNDARYASSFTNDHLKFNQWGRNKIRYSLIEKNIPEHEIEKALAKIDEDDYINLLKSLLNTKAMEIADEPAPEKMNRLYRFAIGRGFEEEIVREIVKTT